MPNLNTQVSGNAIAFIDRLVTDYQSLIAGATPNTEVVVLDGNRDAIDQITQILALRSNIDSIHIISHGAPGSLQLGKTRLGSDNLESYAEKLQQWRSALTVGADILIYGCNVASTPRASLKVRRGINSPSHSASRLKPTENKLTIQSSLEDFRYETGVETNGGPAGEGEAIQSSLEDFRYETGVETNGGPAGEGEAIQSSSEDFRYETRLFSPLQRTFAMRRGFQPPSEPSSSASPNSQIPTLPPPKTSPEVQQKVATGN
ncbi:MAG: DUF4347 domain-containing protein [Oscillatoriales cyanobacterium]|nr:MAG: DUF4347 domain-containing protein [Oscillatoriales cyanobacterium]